MTRVFLSMLALNVALGAAVEARGRIKLVTLPVRERVEIQLDHEHATLVEEERIVPLVQGLNQVDFSWANTAIDPETIVFRVAGEDDKGLDPRVLAVSYPPDEQALVWTVASRGSGGARVRISYILGGLTRSFSYRAVAARDERTLELAQYMKINNAANETFGVSRIWAGFGRQFLRPIGLNEQREVQMERFVDVPVRKTYTCDVVEFGYLDRPQNKLRVPMHYVLLNSREAGLGRAALPGGKVRVFQDDGRGGRAFIGEDWGRHTPLDDELRLYVGVAQDVVVRRLIDRNTRRARSGDLFDLDVVLKYEIENFKNSPVTLDIVEDVNALLTELMGQQPREAEWKLGDETTFPGGADAQGTGSGRVLLHAPLPPREDAGAVEKVVHRLHLRIRNLW
jgi:hypothetical protein